MPLGVDYERPWIDQQHPGLEKVHSTVQRLHKKQHPLCSSSYIERHLRATSAQVPQKHMVQTALLVVQCTTDQSHEQSSPWPTI